MVLQKCLLASFQLIFQEIPLLEKPLQCYSLFLFPFNIDGKYILFIFCIHRTVFSETLNEQINILKE